MRKPFDGCKIYGSIKKPPRKCYPTMAGGGFNALNGTILAVSTVTPLDVTVLTDTEGVTLRGYGTLGKIKRRYYALKKNEQET